MNLDEIKSVVRQLGKDDRRKLALYILDLEKQGLQQSLGPQIADDIDAFGRVIQDAVEKIKRVVKDDDRKP